MPSLEPARRTDLRGASQQPPHGLERGELQRARLAAVQRNVAALLEVASELLAVVKPHQIPRPRAPQDLLR